MLLAVGNLGDCLPETMVPRRTRSELDTTDTMLPEAEAEAQPGAWVVGASGAVDTRGAAVGGWRQPTFGLSGLSEHPFLPGHPWLEGKVASLSGTTFFLDRIFPLSGLAT